jgi:hypothetical protein
MYADSSVGYRDFRNKHQSKTESSTAVLGKAGYFQWQVIPRSEKFCILLQMAADPSWQPSELAVVGLEQ